MPSFTLHSSRSAPRGAMNRAGHGAFWAAVVLMIAAFAFGGGARGDVRSLLLLRPFAALLLVVGLWRILPEQRQLMRPLWGFLVACAALIMLHLVPLPPALWQALPGRELATDIAKLAGQSSDWRPISLVPQASWNALFALLVPAAMLAWLMNLTTADQARLLPWATGLCLFSGVVGLFQMIGVGGSALYFYAITNVSAGTGLFANANHNAAFLACGFPMLAAFASTGLRTEDEAHWRRIGCAVAAALLVPMILATGSRAGIVLMLAGIVAAYLCYAAPQGLLARKRKAHKLDIRPAVGVGVGIVLVILAVVLFRSSAFERLQSADVLDDVRLQIWGPVLAMGRDYAPLGSGIGSFTEIYQVHEDFRMLSTSYVNHAHNDVAEIWLTAGVPGLVLLLIALVWVLRKLAQALRQPPAQFGGPTDAQHDSVIFARMGGAILVMLGAASIVDYPLRTPSLAVIAVLAAVWLTRIARPANADESISAA